MSSSNRLTLVMFVLFAATGLGCATRAAPDPIEPFNRRTFAFNEHLDRAVMKPVATTYVKAVPIPVRRGVSNLFDNAADLWSATNLLLQGELRDGAREVVRFGLNTTVGVFGIFDVATSRGLDRRRETFGRTLGRWGVEPGAYFVWPLLGPSTARDSAGLPLDMFGSPLSVISSVPVRLALTSANLVSERASALPLTDMIDEIALDKYLYVRDAYLQRHETKPKEIRTNPCLSPPAAAEPASAVTAQPRAESPE